MLRLLCRAVLVSFVGLAACVAFGAFAMHTVHAGRTIVVNSLGDNDCSGSTVSLRCAIETANNDASGDTITFGVGGTISPTSPLPELRASSTTIDGGGTPNTNPMGSTGGDKAVITVRIDGASAGSPADGLMLGGSGDVVRGLSITGFQSQYGGGVGTEGFGIEVFAPGCIVAGNFLGVTPAGTATGNANGGVDIDGFANASASATIGGPDPQDANVISGNNLKTSPPAVSVGLLFSNASNSKAEGNYIGTDPTGTKAVGNYDGINLTATSQGLTTSDVIGGTALADRNVISGNASNGYGIEIQGASGDVIEGNVIGTDPTGKTAVANTDGINVSDVQLSGGTTVFARNNTIGGSLTTAGVCNGACNLISGNASDGVDDRSSNTTISGNFIGTDVTGKTALGNGRFGVLVGNSNRTGQQHDVIGGVRSGSSCAGPCNLIDGNGQVGVIIANGVGSGSTPGATVEGNFVGTDATGTTARGTNGQPLANGGGIALAPITGVQPTDNLIGGSRSGTACTGACNLISGNADPNVLIQDTGSNTVEGNFIGTNIAGTGAVQDPAGVQTDGVLITSTGGGSASGNLIGGSLSSSGTCSGPCNLISGNTFGGVHILDAGPNANLAGDTGNANQVEGNYIGTTLAGSAPLPNTQAGVLVNSDTASRVSTGNLVGGSAEEGNVIGGNGQYGVEIYDASSNLVTGNHIGTDPSGTHAVANGSGVGIFGDATIGAAGNDVGVDPADTSATCDVPCNVISGNTYDGVQIADAGVNSALGADAPNRVSGNFIGSTASGMSTLGNGRAGVLVYSDGTAPADGTIVGGAVTDTTCSGSCNLLVGNGFGVALDGAVNSLVKGNFIGTNPADATTLGNGTGILVQAYAASGGKSVQATGNTIGGERGESDCTGACNLISGNVNTGVGIFSTGPNDVQGNFIGTDETGTIALINKGDGVLVQGTTSAPAADNIIGGATAALGNLISGNPKDVVLDGATSTTVAGNFVGTDVSGSEAITGGAAGNLITLTHGASKNTIGGSRAGDGCDAPCNLLSGSGSRYSGVAIVGASTNTIVGNFIGTDSTGATNQGSNGLSLGNGYGVLIESNTTSSPIHPTGATANTVGGTSAGDGNLISGNSKAGVAVIGASSNSVLGNLIGTTAAGNEALANSGSGVLIQAGPLTGAGGNHIGAARSGDGCGGGCNLISGNEPNGVTLDAGSAGSVTGNFVQGNYIGTKLDGGSELPNSESGIVVKSSGGAASGNTIGGTAGADGNIISGNPAAGVQILDASTTTLQNNVIGLDAAGTAKIPNGTGVDVSSDGKGPIASGTTIGTAGSGNVIGDNAAAGVALLDASGSTIQANKIGVAADGDTAAPNGVGIDISNDGAVSTSGNTIGGTATGDGNTISGNTSQDIGTEEKPAKSSGDGIDVNGASNVTIQGNTIGADAGGSKAVPNAAGIVIGPGAGASGSLVAATSDTVGGSAPGAGNLVSGNTGPGLDLQDTGNDTVQGNEIGVNGDGSEAVPNGAGVVLESDGVAATSGNAIGGTASGAGNLISGNAVQDGSTGVGIYIAGATNSSIEGNTVGVDRAGTSAVPNEFGIVVVPGTVSSGSGSINSSVTIGGTGGAGNLISGNTEDGVKLLDVSNNTIQGNVIGADRSGAKALGNGAGIAVTGDAESPTNNNLIGGTGAGEGNVISGNEAHALSDGTTKTTGDGIDVDGAGSSSTPGAIIQGNLIGTDTGGAKALGNDFGIRVTTGVAASSGFDLNSNVTIGGAQTTAGACDGACNLISGNTETGVELDDVNTDTVAGNFIGTNLAGDTALGNGAGVAVEGAESSTASNHNTIGGSSADLGNLISGNAQHTLPDKSKTTGDGIDMDGTSDNTVSGNIIGLNAAGDTAIGADTKALGNETGISVAAISPLSAKGVNSQFNVIGISSTGAGSGNVISGNSSDGIDLLNVSNNSVGGNRIGTSADGSTATDSNNKPLGNTGDGISVATSGALAPAQQNTIGGSIAGMRNVVSGNTGNGISIADASNNLVQGNYVGLSANGSQALANGANGIDLTSDGKFTTTSNPIEDNVVSGNKGEGVNLFDATGNTLAGNLIGTDPTGATAMGNGDNGVAISSDSLTRATNNLIGGTVAGSRNVISGNTQSGIVIQDAGAAPSSGVTTGNTVQGNYIGTDKSGTTAVGNGAGIMLASDGKAPTLNNTVGGTTSVAANYIAGNAVHSFKSGTTTEKTLGDGVELDGTKNNTVEGNFIGQGVNGAKVGNAGDGVDVVNKASGDMVGGSTATAGNVIAFNAGDGVLVGSDATDAVHTAIRHNSMLDNANFGIALNGQAASSCTTGSAGAPNDYTPCPTITASSASAISGRAPAGTTVDVYVDASEGGNFGSVQGSIFLGSATATSSNTWTLSAPYAAPFGPGEPITATATTAGSSSVPAETSQFAPPGNGNVMYHSGDVVTGTLHTYAIFWGAPATFTDSKYQTLLDQFLTDTAHDSGKTTNVFFNETQYSQTISGATTHVSYSQAFGGSDWDQTNPASSTCSSTLGGSVACVTDSQLQAEIEKVIAQKGWPAGGLGNEYFVFLGNGISTCSTLPGVGGCFGDAFCAYHASFTDSSGHTLLYGDMPYAGRVGAGCTQGQQSPNGDLASDTVIDVLSHEMNETITDPLTSSPGWYDATGHEIADKCEGKFGTPLGSTSTGSFNQVINGHDYWLQGEWSNVASACVWTGTSARLHGKRGTGAPAPGGSP